MRLLTGLIAAALYSLGEEFWNIIASILFVFSLVLDRADGILARLKKATSNLGHKFDLVADTICNASVFLGIGISLRHSDLGEWAILMGLITGISIAIVLIVVTLHETKHGIRSAEITGRAGFDPDDAMLFVPLATISGFEKQLIIAAAIGATLCAIFFFWKYKKAISE